MKVFFFCEVVRRGLVFFVFFVDEFIFDVFFLIMI